MPARCRRRGGGLRALLIALLLPLFFCPVQAFGQSLDAAKAAGQIGERPDGFLGLVNPAAASAADRELVASINARRRTHYARIATEQQTSLEVVAVLAGSKLVARTPPGQYYMSESGTWLKR